MAEIRNSDSIRALREATNLFIGVDNVPSSLSSSIVPTIEMNPDLLRKCNIVKTATATNTTSTTAYTTPVGQRFVLMGATISVIKDASSPSTSSSIGIFKKGEATNLFILPISGIALTAQSASLSAVFPGGIEIEPGTAITARSSSGTAEISTSISIWGYLIKNQGAGDL